MRITKAKEHELLFELSLAVGSSLNAKENAAAFLKSLTQKLGAYSASVWHRSAAGGYTLTYAYPERSRPVPSISDEHPMLLRLAKQRYFLMRLESPDFEQLWASEYAAGQETVALFRMQGFGFLKLSLKDAQENACHLSMEPLSRLIEKFGLSLDACMLHERLREQQRTFSMMQEQLEQSVYRYHDLFENMYDALLLLDEHGNITNLNRAAKAMLEYPEGDPLPPVRLADLVHPDDREKSKRFLQQLREQGAYSNYRGRILTLRGNVKFVEVNSNAIFDDNGQFIGSRDIVRDVTEQVHTEQRLRLEKGWLEAVVKNLQAGIVLEDTEGKIALANEQFCHALGITAPPEALSGKAFREVAEESQFFFEKPEKFMEDVQQCPKQNTLAIGLLLHTVDDRILRRDFVPIHSGEEQLGCLWQYQDVTVQERAQESVRKSEEKYRGIMENMELGLLEVDQEGRITKAYDRFAAMLGYEVEELLGHYPEELFLPQEFQAVMEQQKEDRLSGKAAIYELQLERKDSNRIWALVSGAPILDGKGNVIGSLGIHYDITERKMLERHLKEAKLQAEKAQRAEQQFLANMSHEIRTPMNAVIGMAHLLEGTNPTETQREYLNALRFSADSLLSLIDNVLDFAKIESGEVEFEHRLFSLQQMMKGLQRTYQFRVKDKPVSINLDMDPAVEHLLVGDSTRLNQILSNLLGNASKFTARGMINLSSEVLHKSETAYHIRLRVSDTGIGIPKEKAQLIFENFKQADAQVTRKYGGTGLGLAIVKHLVELQGGTIAMESKPEQGTAFTLELLFGNSGQLDQGNTPSPYDLGQHARLFRGLSALVVEDNPMNQKLIAHILDSWGCDYTLAQNGREGVLASRQRPFDFVLMDIHMPEVDGCEATAQIRGEAENPNRQSLIVGLTAAALLDEKHRALEAGMDEFLTKPFSQNALLQLIVESLKIDMKDHEDERQPAPSGDGAAPVVSLDYLQEFSGGDTDFIHEMVETFLEEAPKNIEKLCQAFEAEQWEDLYRAAHQLKPNYKMLGMASQENTAIAIEKAARDELPKSRLPQLVESLKQNTEAALPLLQQELGEL